MRFFRALQVTATACLVLFVLVVITAEIIQVIHRLST